MEVRTAFWIFNFIATHVYMSNCASETVTCFQPLTPSVSLCVSSLSPIETR